MQLQKVLLENARIEVGEEKRLLPGLDVSAYDRLHFHISGGSRTIPNLSVRILFGTPVESSQITLLSDSTVWFEDTVSERDFSFTTSARAGTGFIMSVPVVAPLLYDVILENRARSPIETAYVTVMSQDI